MKWRRPLAIGERSVNSNDSVPQSTRRAIVPSQAANVYGSTQPVSAVLAPRIDETYSTTWSGSAPNWADPRPSPVRISSWSAIGSVVVVTRAVVGMTACVTGAVGGTVVSAVGGAAVVPGIVSGSVMVGRDVVVTSNV